MLPATLSQRRCEVPISSVSRADALVWAMVSVAICADVWLLSGLGISVAIGDLFLPAVSVFVLSLAAFWYARRQEPAFVLALTSLIQIVVFASSFTILMYCTAALGAPMQDRALLAFDSACGVRVGSIVAWVDAHSTLKTILTHAYDSMMIQTAMVIIVLGLRQRTRALQGFVVLFMATALVSNFGLALLPADGPYEAHGYDPNVRQQAFMADLHALRSGQLTQIHVSRAEGLVTCPSFHTIWALLLIWAFWNVRGFRWATAVLNGMIVFSTLGLGWHYFADVLAGLVVAVLGVAVWTKSATWLYDPEGSPRRVVEYP